MNEGKLLSLVWNAIFIALGLTALPNPALQAANTISGRVTNAATGSAVQAADIDVFNTADNLSVPITALDGSPAMTDSTELLGIIVRNTEEAVELAPLGVPMAGDNGTMDINPISILETTAGLALTTKTADDLSMCCLLSNHYPITAATTDSDGYVGFSSVGSIATADAGDVQVTTTAATTSSYSTGRR